MIQPLEQAMEHALKRYMRELEKDYLAALQRGFDRLEVRDEPMLNWVEQNARLEKATRGTVEKTVEVSGQCILLKTPVKVVNDLEKLGADVSRATRRGDTQRQIRHALEQGGDKTALRMFESYHTFVNGWAGREAYWSGSFELRRKQLVKALKGTVNRGTEGARVLIAGLRESAGHAPVLFRGLRVPASMASDWVERKGSMFDVPISSFSSNKNTALRHSKISKFREIDGPVANVLFEVKKGGAGMRLDTFGIDTDARTEKEWLNGGRFRVLSTTVKKLNKKGDIQVLIKVAQVGVY
jgi:hypothetical protein